MVKKIPHSKFKEIAIEEITEDLDPSDELDSRIIDQQIEFFRHSIDNFIKNVGSNDEIWFYDSRNKQIEGGSNGFLRVENCQISDRLIISTYD